MEGLAQLMAENVSWVDGDGDNMALDNLVQQYRDMTNYESDEDNEEDESPRSSNTQESVNRPLNLPESIPISSWEEPILPLGEPIPSQANNKPSKRELFTGMIRYVLKPLTKIWNREAVTEAMPDKKKQIENIAFQYCGNLLYLVSNDNLPADAVSAFESILTHDLAFCKDAVPIAFQHPGALNYEGIVEVQGTLALGMPQLINLLELSLRTIKRIDEVLKVQNDRVSSESLIRANSLEHILCNQYRRNVYKLYTRLHVLSRAGKRVLAGFMDDELVRGLLKLSEISESNALDTTITNSVLPSGLNELLAVTLTLIQSIIRLIALLCHMWYQKLEELEEQKLFGLTVDLTLCIEDFYDAVTANKLEYAEALSKPVSSSKSSVAEKFTREYKIAKDYETISQLSEKVMEKVNVAKEIASRLKLCKKEDATAFNVLVDQLETEHSAAEELVKSLVDQMGTQTLAIRQLRQEQSSDRSPANNASHLASDTAFVTLQDTMQPTFTTVNNETNMGDQTEFQSIVDENPDDENMGGEDFEIVVSCGEKYEVFMGHVETGEGEKDEPTASFSVQEKLATKTYSSVMAELRTALAPVKTKMDARENEAIRKIYGDVQDDKAASSNTKPESETVDKAMEVAVGEPSANSSSHDQASSEREEKFEERDVSLDTPLMGELKSVINAGLQKQFFCAAENFGDNSDSETSDKDE